MSRKTSLAVTVVATFIASLLVGPGAGAGPRGGGPPHAPSGNDRDFYYEHHTHQHGGVGGHLDPIQQNVDMLSKLKLANFVDDISDVSALQAFSSGKWFAYVGDWGAKCQTGGIHVVDISDPSNPVKTGFINATGTGYRTEGVQGLRISTSAYTGDILIVSNEWCLPKANPKLNPGGISIYDVNNPTQPKTLVDAFGDFDLYGNRANESHSVIAWDAGTKAYAAAIDNEELKDVDIFDITNPRSPAKIAETELPGVRVNGFGNFKTSHDFDVLRFPNGTWHLMVSDWDAGWIDVDVTNPSNPTIVGDFDYDACDRLIPTACPPEGNAHQGEWNADGSLFIGTDEDSSPFRVPLTVLDGPLAGQVFAGGEFGWTKSVASFPNEEVNGPTVFGGYGCPDDRGSIPPPSVLGTLGPDEESIIVFERGPVSDPNHNQHAACFFSEKVESGELAGYDVVVIPNHHIGAQGGEQPDAFFCGGQGTPVAGTAAGLCVGHRWMHEAFGKPADYTVPYPVGDPGDLEPNIGDLGPRIRATSEFDGWGCARLIDAAAMTEIDEYCLTEELDPAFSSGFGDLTVHEVEIPRGDPNEGGPAPDDGRLAYFSWYSGGFRVVAFDSSSIYEVGAFIDQGGNDLWGVALAEDQNGDRIVLVSDRDFGLYVLRYTGP